MSGPLKNSPAEVIATTLLAMGLGSSPTSNPVQAWPIFATNEPSGPDNCITVYDTEGIKDGRTMIDGEVQLHHGFQIRVRSLDHSTGYQKANAIAIAIDEQVNQMDVTISPNVYIVWAISRKGDVIPLGTEGGKSKRSLFTINAIVALQEIA